MRQLLASLAAWRVPVRWYVSALGGAALRAIPLAYALAVPFGPLGEELGWRGYALPRLLSRFNVWTATFILGIVWTFWHVPMMLFRPGASIPSFLEVSPATISIYLVQIVSGAAMLTLLFIGTGGSVLLAVLGHLGLNTSETIVFNGLPGLSGAQIREIYFVNVGLLACIAFGSLVLAARLPERDESTACRGWGRTSISRPSRRSSRPRRPGGDAPEAGRLLRGSGSTGRRSQRMRRPGGDSARRGSGLA